MKNTKENRIKFLRNCYDLLGRGSKKDLLKAVNNLSEVLSKKRSTVLIDDFSELRSELRSELGSELGSKLRSELRSEFESELGSELWSELWSEFWSEFWSELRSELWFCAVWEYYENIFPVFVSEFYPNLKTIKKNKEKISAFKEIVEAGNCYLIVSKTKLYAIPMPQFRTNEKKQLHNEEDWALNWLGKKTYWLNGVKFEKKLWGRIVRNEISGKELLSLKNTEQRMVALKFVGIENVFNDLNAKLIDKSARGNELYLIEGVFSQPAKFIKKVCPSTGRVYIEGVDPKIEKADEAVAWQMDISPQEYAKLKIET